MKDKSRKEYLIARAKRSALGRFLCRIAGDNAGQALMEYVVLGVMVVAAVVAIVLLFGQQMRVGFNKMAEALKGSPNEAAEVEDVESTKFTEARNKGHETASEEKSYGELGQ